MAVAVLGVALGATLLDSDAATLLRYAGGFFLGLGILLRSRRNRAAWPVILAWPLLLLVSDLVALSARRQSVRGFYIGSCMVLVLMGGLIATWIRERKGSHVA